MLHWLFGGSELTDEERRIGFTLFYLSGCDR